MPACSVRKVNRKTNYFKGLHFESWAAIGLITTLGMGAASAAVPTIRLPTDQDAQPANQDGPFAFTTGIGRSGYMLGDLWGLRSFLSRYGTVLGLQETSEELGNVSGGVKRSFDYDGLSQAVLQTDTQRAFGWYGGTFNASGLWLHGRNLSANNLDALQTVSGIEGDRAWRVWEVWYQQKFLEEDRADIKIGQQSLDQEFMVSQNANYFVNTMFGWAMLPSADLPGGGPAYPLSALGARLRLRPINPIQILVGVFNGSPAADTSEDSQISNPHGTSLPRGKGVLALAEVQYSYPSLGALVRADDAEPLACLYKLGVWYDSGSFSDLRYDQAGLSLADPASSGVARTHKGDYAFYGVADQMIWRDDDDADRNANLFLRAMYTPLSDRNLISFSLNAGLLVHEPIRHRDDDVFGLGMGYARVSSAARGLDQDTGTLGGMSIPVRSSETFIEATYQYALTPWWNLQPDVQYIIHPGGGVQDPNDPSRTIRNEFVIGVRTNVLF
jgi:porin